MNNILDIAIIGGGPAGLTSAIYGKRANLNVAVFEKGLPGGQLNKTSFIENYPGFKNIEGYQLALNMKEQVEELDIPIIHEEVKEVIKEDNFVINNKYKAKTIIIATGTEYNEIGIPGDNLKGISYCAVCDGNFFRNKEVAVIGGGDSAFEEAIYLSKIVKKVTIVHRRDQFRAQPDLVEKVKKIENIEFVLNVDLKSFEGNRKVEKIHYLDKITKEEKTLEVDGIFVYIGNSPKTDFIQNVEKDNNYLKANKDSLHSSIPGVFIAGDVRDKEIRQVTTAVSDGSIASLNAYNFIEDNK